MYFDQREYDVRFEWGLSGLRVALEDLMGAGAIISCLDGEWLPEAETPVASFRSAQADLLDTLRRCGSGKELIGRGFAEDVRLAGQLNVSDAARLLVDGATKRDV